MRILLDTNVFLFIIMDDPKLSDNAAGIFLDIDNEIYLSMASIWEIIIKYSNKKLSLPGKPMSFLRSQLRINSVRLLPIRMGHAEKLLDLPPIHKDPFDRLIISQALRESMPVLSSDPLFSSYGVTNLY